MPDFNLHLPQPLVELDESVLPQSCRDEVARMVGLGYRREHMMIAVDFRVYISPELALLHCDLDADDDHS
jgi:hypothetical protein